jgi:hypothetical protein
MSKYAVTLVICAVLVVFLTSFGSAVAQANHRVPTDDTWTQDTVPTSNFDNSQLLADYSNLPSFVITRRIYLRFDLSPIATDVGDGTNVRLYINLPPLSTDGTLAIYSTGDDWNGLAAGNGNETTLTFNNAPSPSTLLATSVVATSSAAWLSFNSSALHTYINSQRASNGGDNTVSFAIQWNSCTPSCSLDEDMIFEDREDSGGSGHPPELITFTPTSVTLQSFIAAPLSSDNALWLISGVLMLIIVGGLLVSRRRHPHSA